MLEKICAFLGIDLNKGLTDNIGAILKWVIPITIMAILTTYDKVLRKIDKEIKTRTDENSKVLIKVLSELSNLSNQLNNVLNEVFKDNSELRSKYTIAIQNSCLVIDFEDKPYININYLPALLIEPIDKNQYNYFVKDFVNDDTYTTRENEAVVAYILKKIKQ